MKKLSTMNDVLDFAISGESKAAELYTKMASTTEQEAEHKRRFEMEYESLTS